MQQQIPLEDITRKGAMTKSPFDMTAEEYAQWKGQVQCDAREYLYSIGQPYVTEKDGQFIAEFADGRVQTIR